MTRKFLLIAALIASAHPARADNMTTLLGDSASRDHRPDELSLRASLVDNNEDLKDAVADPLTSNTQVREMAANIFDSITEISISIDRSSLRRWDFEPAPDGKDASIENIIETADKRFYYYNKEVPPPELIKAHRYVHLLRNEQKIDFDSDGRMGASQMGEYAFVSNRRVLGSVTLNAVLRGIAKLVGRAFILPTFFHEADHARVHLEGNSDPDAVIEKEVSASMTEYWLLQLIDPYGERLHYLQSFTRAKVEKDPSDLNRAALAYMNHLAELNATEGDRDRIKEFVLSRGYKDGTGKNDAAHPTRS